MRLNLKTKSALSVGLSVLVLIMSVGTWREHRTRLDYLSSLQAQQKLLTDTKAEGVADTLELLVGLVERAALDVDPAALGDAAAQHRFFERTVSARAVFTGFSLIGLDGSIIASDPPPSGLAPVNVRDRDYFAQVLAAGKPVVSEPLVARTSHQPVVIIAAPLRDARGHMIAVLAGGIQLLRLNVLTDLAHDQTGVGGFFVLATRGRHPVYLVHPDPSKVLQPVSDTALAVESASLDDMQAASDTADAVIVTHSPVRLTHWELTTILPAQEAFAPVRLATNRLMASYAWLGAAAGLLAWLSTALLLRPLSRLNSAVQKVRASPASDLALGRIHDDEIGDLAASFGSLLAQIRAQQAELGAAQDASPLGLFRCGADGKVTHANDSYREILGLRQGQSQDDWIGMVREEIRDRVAFEWARAASSAEPYGGLLRMKRPDGRSLLVSVKTAPIVVDGAQVGRSCTLEDVTEREENAKAQRMLLGVFDATPDFVVQNDFKSRMTYMNPAARRMTGLSADESISQRWVEDFVPEWVVARMTAEIVPAAMSTGVWIGETAVFDDDRNEVPVSHLLIVHRSSRGRVERISSIMRDVSATKAAERALLQSQQRLELVTDNMPALISYLDTDLRFLFANRVYKDWFGYDPEAMLGRSLLEVYGEAVFQLIRPRMEAALAGERVSYEREAVTIEGQRNLLVEVTPQRDERGRVAGLYVLMSDITPRRQAEQALRQSEQRLRSITDRLPMRVAFVGRDERYRFANPAAALALGRTVDDMVGHRVEELFSSDHYRQLNPYIRRALAGEAVSFEFESTGPEAYRCFTATYVPQRDDDGVGVSGFISIIGEITAQKLAERRLVEMSQVDSLTGLSNRAGFEARLASTIRETFESKAPMALLYLDIDRFKSINDAYGHVTGDKLLKAFARRLTRTVRGTDTTTRLGGDEFTVILSGLAAYEDASTVAAHVVAAMQPPFILDARSIQVTTSIGAVVYRGESAITATQLVQQADALLYRAKESGRNAFFVEAARPGESSYDGDAPPAADAGADSCLMGLEPRE